MSGYLQWAGARTRKFPRSPEAGTSMVAEKLLNAVNEARAFREPEETQF
jgi:hypothetical protein